MKNVNSIVVLLAFFFGRHAVGMQNEPKFSLSVVPSGTNLAIDRGLASYPIKELAGNGLSKKISAVIGELDFAIKIKAINRLVSGPEKQEYVEGDCKQKIEEKTKKLT